MLAKSSDEPSSDSVGVFLVRHTMLVRSPFTALLLTWFFSARSKQRGQHFSRVLVWMQC